VSGTIDATGVLLDKHNLRSAAIPGWNAEAWTDGSLYEIETRVDLYVRLCSKDPSVKEIPAVEIALKLSNAADERLVRKTQFQPVFTELAKLGSRREYTFTSDGKMGPITASPVTKGCWEARIRNALKSGRALPGSKPLARGDYMLTVEASLKGHDPILFKAMPLRLRTGADLHGIKGPS
jgi:hypothetical protein